MQALAGPPTHPATRPGPRLWPAPLPGRRSAGLAAAGAVHVLLLALLLYRPGASAERPGAGRTDTPQPLRVALLAAPASHSVPVLPPPGPAALAYPPAPAWLPVPALPVVWPQQLTAPLPAAASPAVSAGTAPPDTQAPHPGLAAPEPRRQDATPMSPHTAAAPPSGGRSSPAAARFVAVPADRRQCPEARYPALLRSRGIEGTVQLRVQVASDGRAGAVELLQGSGFRLLDEAALAQARGCRFEPAREGHQAVDSWVEFAVRFALQDGA
jgi:periplasmic protein TonB